MSSRQPATAQQIGQIEIANQGRADFGDPITIVEVEVQTTCSTTQIAGTHIALTRAIGQQGDAGNIPAVFFDQFAAKGIVRIDYHRAKPRHGKQPFFGFGVARHVTVIIEMVLTQIGKQRHIECNRVHPMLIEPMGRHFHGNRSTSVCRKIGEIALNRNRVCGGQFGRVEVIQWTAAEGTEHG